jgi:hypothetical protein
MQRDKFSIVIFFREIIIQLKGTWLLLLIYSAILLLFLSGILVISNQSGIGVEIFTMDPSAIAEIHPFYGIVSTIGVLLWTATASVCIFTYIALKDRLERNQKKFLLFSALLTLYLLIDDAFLLHDFLVPYYLHIDQKYVVLLGLFLILAYLVGFFRMILRTEYVLIFLALVYFGLSVVMDYLSDYQGVEISYLLEDGFKLFGITTWFIYFFRTSMGFVRKESPGSS